MKRFAFGLILLLAMVGLSQGQETTTTPATVPPPPDLAYVLSQCELYATQLDADGQPTPGLCLTPVRAYLEGLKATVPPLEPAALDQLVTDLVLALVPLAQLDPECNAIDSEIAEAIRLASTYVSTPEQAALLLEIADTVAACTVDDTSALRAAPPSSPSAG